MKKTIALIITLTISFIAFAQVTIKGRIEKDRDSVISFYRNRHPISEEPDNMVHSASIKKDGHFEITIPEDNIGAWIVKGKGRFQVIHLTKGKTYMLHNAKDKNHFVAVGENAD